MAADPGIRKSRSNRFAIALVILGVAVFALGAIVGYHAIYRGVSVAMLAPPPAVSPL